MSPARTSASAKKKNKDSTNNKKNPKRLVSKDSSSEKGSEEKDMNITWNGMKLVKISIEHCKS